MVRVQDCVDCTWIELLRSQISWNCEALKEIQSSITTAQSLQCAWELPGWCEICCSGHGSQIKSDYYYLLLTASRMFFNLVWVWVIDECPAGQATLSVANALGFLTPDPIALEEDTDIEAMQDVTPDEPEEPENVSESPVEEVEWMYTRTALKRARCLVDRDKGCVFSMTAEPTFRTIALCIVVHWFKLFQLKKIPRTRARTRTGYSAHGSMLPLTFDLAE